MVGKPVEIITIFAMLFSLPKVLTLILYYGEKQRFLDARKLTRMAMPTTFNDVLKIDVLKFPEKISKCCDI